MTKQKKKPFVRREGYDSVIIGRDVTRDKLVYQEYPSDQVMPCPYCNNHKNALKSAGECYFCFLERTCPLPLEKIQRRDGGDEYPNIRSGVNKHICNSIHQPSKTKWNEYEI